MMNLYQIEGLVHSYNDTDLVLCIQHWQMAAGGITGLIGPNGSGKSTLLKMLGLVERPTQGTIYFKGEKANPFTSGLRGRIALLPQEAYLLKRSIYKNIAYGLRIRGERINESGRVGEALKLVGLPGKEFADRSWFALSGGEARRVALAARLALHPEVLLLDEPTASVDDASAQLMKEAVLHAHRHWGTSLIIASHDSHWLQEVCSDLVHLFKGRLLGQSNRTLLHGPWKERNEQQVYMQLGDGQTFVVRKPPTSSHASAVAVDSKHLALLGVGKHHAGPFCIEGLLVSLSLNKQSGGVEAVVSVGRTSFKVNIHPNILSEGRFVPGSKVKITYDPEAVEWF
jgi:tungstate transport system ATP-binding protein